MLYRRKFRINRRNGDEYCFIAPKKRQIIIGFDKGIEK